MTQPALRCDLHVHSVHSGRVNLPVLRHFGNDSYSDPVDVYETARLRGMDLVTLTDHDTIDGALAIAHLPGTFLSEEITCELPGGRQLHVNAFGIDETQHARISRLRFDAEALFAYLREEGIAASVNHLFSAVTGPRELADIALALQSVRLIEVRNGRYARTTADVVRNFGGGYRELAPRAGAGVADLARFAAGDGHDPVAARAPRDRSAPGARPPVPRARRQRVARHVPTRPTLPADGDRRVRGGRGLAGGAARRA